MKKIILLVSLLCIVGVMSGCSNRNTHNDASNNPEESIQIKDMYKVGEYASLGNLEIQVKNVSTNAGGASHTPKEGYEYLMIDIVLENIGQSTETYESDQFVLHNNQDQVIGERINMGSNEQEVKSITIPSNESVALQIAFEVPLNDSSLKLLCGKNSLVDKEIIYDLSKKIQ